MSNTISPEAVADAAEQQKKSLSPELVKKSNEQALLLFRNKFLELVETSTSHGLPNIVRTKRLSIKILWTICLLTAIAGCSYMVFESISDYCGYDVVTKIEKITELKSRFPTVSICKRDPLTSIEAQNQIEYYASNINKRISPEIEFKKLIENIITGNKQILLLAFTDKINKTLLGPYPYLLRCSFNDKEYTINDFEHYYDIDLGNCLRFNSGKNASGDAIPFFESSKTGEKYGLKMMFFSPFLENLYSSTFSEGLRIFIHNESITPANSEGKHRNYIFLVIFYY
jgi:hypothetical protein